MSKLEQIYNNARDLKHIYFIHNAIRIINDGVHWVKLWEMVTDKKNRGDNQKKKDEKEDR